MKDFPVVFMANDGYAGWARAFLHSLRKYAPAVPAYCIPYAEDLDTIRHMQGEFGFTLLEPDYTAIDAFAVEMFGEQEPRRHRLRKLAMFDLPGAPFLYLDCDLLVTCPLDRVLASMLDSGADVIYGARSPEFTYAEQTSPEVQERFGAAAAFSSGNFAVLRRGFGTAEIMSLIRSNLAFYKRVRGPYCFDQPIINFACHAAGLRLMPLEDAVPGFTGEGFYQDHRIKPAEGGGFVRDGSQVVAIHWAGRDKANVPEHLMNLARVHGLPVAAEA